MKIFNSFSKGTGLERTPASNHATTGTPKTGISNAAFLTRMMRRFTSSTEGQKQNSGLNRLSSPAVFKGPDRPRQSSQDISLPKVLGSSLQGYKSRHTTIFYNLSAFVGFCRLLYACCMGFVGFFGLFEPHNPTPQCRMSAFVARQELPSHLKTV
jgi:hypothetical protein